MISTTTKQSNVTQIADGLILEEAACRCGGKEHLETAVREGRVMKKGGASFFRKLTMTNGRTWTESEGMSRLNAISDDAADAMQDSIASMFDEIENGLNTRKLNVGQEAGLTLMCSSLVASSSQLYVPRWTPPRWSNICLLGR